RAFHVTGVQTCALPIYAESLKKVSNSADSAKTHFVLIDAVGVEKSLKTESRPLEKKPGATLDQLLKSVAVGGADDDTVLSLGNQIGRASCRERDGVLGG